MAASTLLPSTTQRLAAARRFYFYIVALVSLVAGLVAVDHLLRVLSGAWLGSDNSSTYLRNTIASNGALLLVAAPVFLLHWNTIQRRFTDADERGSALRKLFLYGASAVCVYYVLWSLYQLIRGLSQLAFGLPPEVVDLLPSEWLHWTAMGIIAGLLLRYLQAALQSDGDYGHELGAAGTFRRLYQTAAGLAAVGMLLLGGSQILQVAWQALLSLAQPAIGLRWWQTMLSDGLAAVLVGLLLARVNWRSWNAIIDHHPTEGTTALRRFYLYAAVLIGAVAALTPAALLLRKLLLILFGQGSATTLELLEELSVPVSLIPLGAAIWVWYWRYLQAEVGRYGESAEGATVRRLYNYVVAAIGLVLLWIGIVSLLQALIDWLLNSDRIGVSDPPWLEPLAAGLSLIAVGAPVWSLHWRTVQTLSRESGETGRDERRSAPRRLYLYGFALAATIVFFVFIAQVLYRLLLVILGDPNAVLFSAETANDLAASLMAAVVWLVHVNAIRDDARLSEAGAKLAPLPPRTGPDRDDLVRRIAQLETELAVTRAALAEIEGEHAPQPPALTPHS